MFLPNRNQIVDFQSKSTDWFYIMGTLVVKRLNKLMAKRIAYSYEERASTKWKHFPFFYFHFAHSSLVYILLKNFWSLLGKNPHHLETHQSICISNQLLGSHMRQTLNVRSFEKILNLRNHYSNKSDAGNIFLAQSTRIIIWVPNLHGLFKSGQGFFLLYF